MCRNSFHELGVNFTNNYRTASNKLNKKQDFDIEKQYFIVKHQIIFVLQI